MDWAPNDTVFRQIMCILQDSLSGDSIIQRDVGKKIEQFRNVTRDYPNYLVYVFLNTYITDEHIRLMSGLLLKNTLKNNTDAIYNDSLTYIKQECFKALTNLSSPTLRNTLSSIISLIVVKMTVSDWPEFSVHFPKLLEAKQEIIAENSITTLLMICEDMENLADLQFNMDCLFPTLMDMLSIPSSKIRGKTIRCINHFLTKETVGVYGNVVISKLFNVREDEDEFVRREICGTFVLLIEYMDTCNIVCNNSIIEYMLQRTCDANPAVALQACEFWLAFSSMSSCKVSLTPHLKTLITILITYMKYSDDELQQFLVSNNTHEPDSPEDIRPLFHRSYKDPDDEVVDVFDWTIRKCSAASLDALAVCFREDFLPVVIPILKDTIEQESWETKEAGILSLGAIAEGCMDGISHFLPDIVPYLLDMLNHSEPAVRSISCWTLSRYSNWIVTQPQEGYLEPVVIQLLKTMLDKNKKVQQAACSAFSVLLEEARTDIVPYIDLSLHAFISAFEIYQMKSLIILYDSIGTLSHVVGNYLDKPEYISLMLPPLINKWNLIKNEDKALLPLLECMTYVIAALELGFLSHAEPVFDRCRSLVEQSLWGSEQYKQNPDVFDEPDMDFLTVALDLISSIVIGLKTHFDRFLENSNLLTLLFKCVQDPCSEVRQSALALYGDLVKYCYGNMRPLMNDFIPILIENIDRKYEIVCNNAIWAVGEICLKMDPTISCYISSLFPRLVEVLENPPAVKNGSQTAALVICCLGYVCPLQLAPQLPRFIRCCCMSLRNICDCPEKDSGFRGMCQMIAYNPQGVLQDFIYFCDAVASWNAPKEDLRVVIVQIMHTFRGFVGDSTWQNFLEQCPLQMRERLKMLYGVVLLRNAG